MAVEQPSHTPESSGTPEAPQPLKTPLMMRDLYLEKRRLFPDIGRLPDPQQQAEGWKNITLADLAKKGAEDRGEVATPEIIQIAKSDRVNALVETLVRDQVDPASPLLDALDKVLSPEDKDRVLRGVQLHMHAQINSPYSRPTGKEFELFGKWTDYFSGKEDLISQLHEQAYKEREETDLSYEIVDISQGGNVDDGVVGRIANLLANLNIHPSELSNNPLYKRVKEVLVAQGKEADFTRIKQAFFARINTDKDWGFDTSDTGQKMFDAWSADVEFKDWEAGLEAGRDVWDTHSIDADASTDEAAHASEKVPWYKSRFRSLLPKSKSEITQRLAEATWGAAFGAGLKWGSRALFGTSSGWVASAGFGAVTGGYKAYRREVNQQYEKELAEKVNSGDIAATEEWDKLHSENMFKREFITRNNMWKRYSKIEVETKKSYWKKAAVGMVAGAIGGVIGAEIAEYIKVPEIVEGLFKNIKDNASIQKILENTSEGLSIINPSLAAVSKNINGGIDSLKSHIPDIKSSLITEPKTPKSVPWGPVAPYTPGQIPGAPISIGHEDISSPREIPITAKPIKIEIPETRIGAPGESTTVFSDSKDHIEQYLIDNHIDSPQVHESVQTDEYYARQAAEMTAKGLKPDFDGTFSSLKGDVEAQIGNYLMHKPDILKDPDVIEWIKTNRPEIKLESFATQTFNKDNVDHLAMLKAYQQIHPDYYNKMFTTMYGSTKVLNSDNPAAFNSAHPDLFKHGILLRRPDYTQLFDKIMSEPSASLELGHTEVSPFRAEDQVRLPTAEDVKVEIPQPRVGLASQTESIWSIDPKNDAAYLEQHLTAQGVRVEDFKLINPDGRYTYNVNTERIIKTGLTPDFDGSFSSLKGQVEGWVGQWILSRPDIIQELQTQLTKERYDPAQFDFANLNESQRTIVLKSLQKLYPEEYQKMFTDMYGDVKVLNINNPDAFNSASPDLFKHGVSLKRPSLSLFDQYIIKKP